MLLTLQKYKNLLLALLLVITVVVSPGVQRAVQINNSLDIWFLEESPEMQQYRSFQNQFGGDESLIIVLRDHAGILTPDNISVLTHLSAELKEMPEVDLIKGMIQAEELKKGTFGPYSVPILSQGHTREKLQSQVRENQEAMSLWLSEDQTTTQMWVQLTRTPNMDAQRGEIIAKIRETVSPYREDFSVFLGGVGVIFEGLNTLSREDFAKFLGAAYLLVVLLMILIFRRFSYVLYVLAVIGFSTYLTLGLYGTLGLRLNLMSTLIPLIISILGLLDVIHILNEKIYYQNNHQELTGVEALQRVWKPCLFTTLTTMAGFLAVSFTSLPVLQSFGLFTALGIFMCLIFSFFFGLFFVTNLKPAPSPVVSMEKLHGFLQHNQKALRVGMLLLVLGFAWGIQYVVVDTETLHYLPDDHEVVTDHDSILEYWGPYMPFEMTLSTGNGIEDPNVFSAGIAFDEWMDSVPQVAHSISVFSIVEENLSLRQMPSSLFLGQMESLYPKAYSRLVTPDQKIARITAFGSLESASSVKETADWILAKGQRFFPKGSTLKAAGYLPLYGGVANKITEGQIKSLGLALAFIFLLVWAFFKKIKWAFIVLITNIIPVIALFGTMGWLGIPFDLATISIAAIGLSFCIDDSLHFIYGFSQYAQKYPSDSSSLSYKRAFLKVGYAILISSAILFLGYSILLGGQLKTVVLFGGLLAQMIAMALLSQWIVFPWLLRVFEVKK